MAKPMRVWCSEDDDKTHHFKGMPEANSLPSSGFGGLHDGKIYISTKWNNNQVLYVLPDGMVFDNKLGIRQVVSKHAAQTVKDSLWLWEG